MRTALTNTIMAILRAILRGIPTYVIIMNSAAIRPTQLWLCSEHPFIPSLSLHFTVYDCSFVDTCVEEHRSCWRAPESRLRARAMALRAPPLHYAIDSIRRPTLLCSTLHYYFDAFMYNMRFDEPCSPGLS